ncbi:MAG: hypothetical protein GY804_08515 [Alphaproteobacteria bacterium]|nr:hypothetical protein [Alphaproteobacteria bacterium]
MNQYTAANINDNSENQLLGIRESPSTLVGYIGNGTAQTLISREELDNSSDEHNETGQDIPIVLWLHAYPGGYMKGIRDAGRGIPLESHELTRTKLYVSGKQDNSGYSKPTTGAYGCGSKASTACSQVYASISIRPEGTAKLLVKEGEIIESFIEEKPVTDQSGVWSLSLSDPTIFPDTDKFIDGEGEAKLMEFIKFKSAVSDKNIIFEVYKSYGEKPTFDSFEGSAQAIVDLFQIPPDAKLAYKTDPEYNILDYMREYYGVKEDDVAFEFMAIDKPYDGDSGLQAHFIMSTTLKRPKSVISTVNELFMRDQKSDHIVIFIEAVKDMLSEYVEDDKYKAFFMKQYDLPILPIIMLSKYKAKYVGAAKDGFTDMDFRESYYNILMDIFKKRPEKFEKLHELIKDDIEERYNWVHKKVKKLKGLNSVWTILNEPDNYKGCRWKPGEAELELFIAEGKSAGEQIKIARDALFQAVYYLRGKIVNAFTKKSYDTDEIFEDLKQLIGVESFHTDLEKMNFKRIFIVADADIDGLHIATLLLGAFYKINPLIVTSGRICIANPPLYSFAVGRKTLFMKDIHAINEQKINMVYRPNIEMKIRTITNKEEDVTGDYFRSMCYMIKTVGTHIRQAAETIGMPPNLLEMLAYVYRYLQPNDVKVTELSDYFDCGVRYIKEDKSIIMDFEDVELTIPVETTYTHLTNKIVPLIKDAAFDKFQVCLSTKHTNQFHDTPLGVVAITDIFDTLDSQAYISRFKGVGQLTIPQLTMTCVNPRTRAYIQIKEVGTLDKIYDMLGANSIPRKKLIEEVTNHR